MGAQRLSPKSTRRIARSTGLDVVGAWGHGGYLFPFVTAAHEHGLWDKKDGSWEWDPRPRPHYTRCSELFPDWQPPWAWEPRTQTAAQQT